MCPGGWTANGMIGAQVSCKGTHGGPQYCQVLLQVIFAADPLEVRRILALVLRELGSHGLRRAETETAEIVLAEALNNIVEHAYRDQPGGSIQLVISRRADTLWVDLADSGAPMPGGVAPEGRCASMPQPVETLPEGGFGWFLIRSLTRDLSYRREDGCNRLRFRLVPE